MTSDTCAKWHPELPIRCEAPRAHKDDHYSELNGTRYTWPNDRAETTHSGKPRSSFNRGASKQGNLKRRKPLKKQSEGQAVRSAFLAGCKAERIAASIRALGYVECSNCPKRYEGHSVAHQNLDLHHETKRSRGQGYRPGQGFGVDEPGGLVLLCRVCHREVEASEPEWTKGEAS